MKHFIVLFHQLSKNNSNRFDFDSDLDETVIYETLKLENYKLYQFIENDFLYNMELSELDKAGIKYDKLEREIETWFGARRTIVHDILIRPNEDFYYPYQYGHYFYLFSKHDIKANQFKEWLRMNFSNCFADFNELIGYRETNDLKLMNSDDYILITNHDYQQEFGVAANSEIIEELTQVLTKNFKTKMERFNM